MQIFPHANVCCGKQKTNKQTKSGETSGPTNVGQRLKSRENSPCIIMKQLSFVKCWNRFLLFSCQAGVPLQILKIFKFSNGTPAVEE